MKILVIGGAGFLGTNLVRRLLEEKEHEITVLDSLDPQFQSTTTNLKDIWNEIHFVRGSFLDEKILAELVPGKDVIYDLAAQSSHTLSIKNPLLDTEINCLGHLKVLEAVRIFNPEAVVVFPSSTTVVGRAGDAVIDEMHGERPRDVYSANKGVAEKYFQIYAMLHDLKTIVLRFSNLYGSYGKGSAEFGFINYFIHLAQNREPIKIFGQGFQTRNVMYVEDAVDILLQSVKHPGLFGEIYFATSSFHLSVRSIAETILDVFGGGGAEYVPWPKAYREMEVQNVSFSSGKLRSVTGWQAKHSLDEGLEHMKALLENKFYEGTRL